MIFLTIVVLRMHCILSLGKMLRISLCPIQSEHKLQFAWKLDPYMYLRRSLGYLDDNTDI